MAQTHVLKEGGVFFKQWLRAPKEMGSVYPSSQILARALASQVAWQPGQHIVELGGGTGSITQGLIDLGVPRDKLIVIEFSGDLFEFLKNRFPDSNVIQGDATRLDEILARQGVENIGTVVSGLPMVGMPFEFQKAVIEQSFKALRGQGHMLQYSYSPLAPVPAKKLGIHAQIAKFVLRNVPPAFVWKYTKP